MVLRVLTLTGARPGLEEPNYVTWVYAALGYFTSMNIMLFLFNLIPLYPLDGHHLFREMLKGEAKERYIESQRFGMYVLILLVLSLSGLWASTQYVAAHLHYAPQLGPPWAVLGEVRVYPPWGWVAWGRLYQARAPTLFYNAEGITTLGALAGAAIVGTTMASMIASESIKIVFSAIPMDPCGSRTAG